MTCFSSNGTVLKQLDIFYEVFFLLKSLFQSMFFPRLCEDMFLVLRGEISTNSLPTNFNKRSFPFRRSECQTYKKPLYLLKTFAHG